MERVHQFSGNLVTVTDHKPLIGAVKGDKERPSERQQRHISLINEYFSDIVHVPRKDNLVADTLSHSQIASINCNDSFYLISIAKAQQGLTFEDNKYKAFELGDNLQIFCEVSTS